MHDFVLAYKVGFYPYNEKPPGTLVDFYCASEMLIKNFRIRFFKNELEMILGRK